MAVTAKEVVRRGGSSDDLVVSERVARRKQSYLAARPRVCSERAHLVTESWKKTDGQPLAVRKAKQFQSIMEGISVAIKNGELIVGSQSQYVRGASPAIEWDPNRVLGMLEAGATVHTRSEAELADLSAEDRAILLEDARWWKGRSPADQLVEQWQQVFGSKEIDAQNAGLWFPTQNLFHQNMMADYAKVINHGLNRIIAQAKEKQSQLTFSDDVRGQSGVTDFQRSCFYQAVVICCEAVITLAKRYALEAQRLARRESDPERKRELDGIARVCEWVPANGARTFREALQSFWFVQLALDLDAGSGGNSVGRMDQYLYPFYQRDIREGRLTRQDAFELLCLLWTKFVELDQVVSLDSRQYAQASLFQWVTLSGVDREGKDATNDLSWLLLEVTRQMKFPQPTVAVRYHNGLSKDFLIKCLETNRDFGGGMPTFINDQVAQRILLKAGVSVEDTREWGACGCTHPYVPHASSDCGWGGDGNLAKILELTLNNGVDPRTRQQLGPATGDPTGFGSHEQLYEAFRRQNEYFVDLNWRTHNLQHQLRRQYHCEPFRSALLDDCIERGLDWAEGGLRYPYFVMRTGWGKGLVNVADSLAAIKKLVFEEKKSTMAELLHALKVNFEGKEDLRRMLLAAPKCGNDDDAADDILADVSLLVQRLVGKHRRIAQSGGAAHYWHGLWAGALPDGRKAGQPLADGTLSPAQGADHKGPTAVINSVTKVDHLEVCDGTIVNMKINPGALHTMDGLEKHLALLKTYFDRGGYHVQFNIVDRETLLAAQKNPEQYRDLVVRVGGFSAFFVELSPLVQQEIIERTEHRF